jgi:hypothetical protein
MSAISLHLPVLPEYQHSTLVPAYNRVPLQNEQRLSSQLGVGRPPSASTLFRKASKTGSVSLELYGQREDISCPVYGQRNVIRGKVLLQKRDVVSNVVVKVCFNFHSIPKLYLTIQ